MRILLFFALLVMITGCASKLDELRATYVPSSAREAYLIGLEEAGISESVMAKEWVLKGELVLATQLIPTLPYVEEGVVEAPDIVALAYRLDLKRGQRLTAQGFISSNTELFLDLFEPQNEKGLVPKRVASADSLFKITYDVTRSGAYILRLQPEILASGTFRVEIQTEASIVFPVSGKTTRSILSQFGVERDGGRRSHHGVDIFAARGTPVIAVEAGRITSTKIGGLGGKTVWLRNRGGTNFYYAHLDSQMVAEGQTVQPGDTLGLVGNTGNARTTSPHLHFGIYSRGPHDPWHYLFENEPATGSPRVRNDVFGKLVGVSNRMYSAPSTRATALQVPSIFTQARVVGGTGTFLHIRFADDSEGYIPQSQAVIHSD